MIDAARNRIPDKDDRCLLVGAFLVAGGIEINHFSMIFLGGCAIAAGVMEAFTGGK